MSVYRMTNGDTLAAMQAKRLDIIHIERWKRVVGISNGCVNRSRESFKILDISIEVLTRNLTSDL